MAIVDVEIPSGYMYNEFQGDADVERVERRGSNVIFYFNEVCMYARFLPYLHLMLNVIATPSTCNNEIASCS